MSIRADITLHLGDFHLDLAFEVGPGLSVLFGPSGSGKTTVLRTIAGLETPDRGAVKIGGQDVTHLPPHKRRVGYVFQEPRLFPHMNVAKNLDYAARFGARPATGMRDDLIALLDLGALLHRYPAALSGGEAQRVSMARALLSDPLCLCMDEPLSALDAPRKARILPYIERLRDHLNIPILYVTHDVREMSRLSNQVMLIRDGRLTHQGAVQDVLSDPTAAGILGPRGAGSVITVTITGNDPICKAAFDGGELYLPDMAGEIGEKRRLKIAAEDVILAQDMPTGISALNVLNCTITGLTPVSDRAVMVELSRGNTRLLARITALSATRMNLQKGQNIHTIIKAMAFERVG